MILVGNINRQHLITLKTNLIIFYKITNFRIIYFQILSYEKCLLKKKLFYAEDSKLYPKIIFVKLFENISVPAK